MKWLPLIAGVLCCALIVIARILTNRRIRAYHQKAAEEAVHRVIDSGGHEAVFEAGMKMLTNPPPGVIPFSISALYFFSFLGAIGAFFWALFSIGILAAAAIAVGYTLTGLVPSMLKRRP